MIERILLEWEGTPYMPGQRTKGIGTDCVGFLCGVLDEWFGRDPQPLPPGKMSIEDALKIATRYPHKRYKWPMDRVLPGDVFLCGHKGIGHCYIAMCGRIFLHADGKYVCRTGACDLSRWKKLLMIRPVKG